MIRVVREDACDGCGVCVNNCPVGILRIKSGKIKVSGPEMCTDCRICIEVCAQRVFEGD